MTAPIRALLALACAIGIGAVCSWGQTASVSASGPTATARIETEPLALVPPEKFLVPSFIESVRHVTLMAPEDGFVQSLGARVGDQVRERQELIMLDRGEASARLEIAKAELAEKEAALQTAKSGQASIPAAQAQIAIAKAHIELAQLALDNRTIKAPFAGRVLELNVSTGQFVTKGTPLGEIADPSGLRMLVPVDRSRVKVGESIEIECEGHSIKGKISALVPLPERMVSLHELAVPWSLAAVSLSGGTGSNLELGQRVISPFLPQDVVAVIDHRAGHAGTRAGSLTVQVLRNEHVAIVPARQVGTIGTDRLQVTGPFRSNDVVIVASSVNLADGTFVRFLGTSGPEAVETVPPDANAAGHMANISAGAAPAAASSSPAPAAAPAPATTNRVAPIGSPDSAVPKAATSRPGAGRSPSRSATTPKVAVPSGGGSTPF